MQSPEELRDIIVPRLAPYARRISVFGSVARGEATAESDVDILVELRPAPERGRLGLKWFDLEAELAHLLGREVELVGEDTLRPYVHPYVLRDRVLLYDEER